MVAAVKSRIDKEHLSAVVRDITQAMEQCISMQLTAVGNGADTTEDVLQQFTLPANTLKAAGGRYLRIIARGRCAANADVKTMRLYFGASVIATPAAATNGKNWYLELEVFRTGVNTQYVFGCGNVDVTPVTPFANTASAQTETGTILIKCTGQAGTANANDIICDLLTVELIGAAGA